MMDEQNPSLDHNSLLATSERSVETCRSTAVVVELIIQE
jgi:hypothetical protein